MKYINILLLFWFCFSGKAQQVKFALYRSNPCKNTGVLDSSGYYIMALDGKMYNPSGINRGLTLLPEKGEYFVYITCNLSYEVRPEYSVQKVSIKDSGAFILKYTEDKLNNRNVGEGVWSMYYVCEDLANGYQEDFYPNGKIRIRGDFKNGKPKDSLVFFYPNGNLKRRVYYHKHHLFVQQYDTSANITKTNYNKTNSFYAIGYKSTEYFSDGRIKRKESNSKGILRFKEYYPDGKLKIIQKKYNSTDFFESGNANISYHWKIERDADGDFKRWPTFLIYRKEYDENNWLTETDVYETQEHNDNQPKVNINNSNWVVSIRKFKDGKEILNIKDIDPKKYFEKSNNP